MLDIIFLIIIIIFFVFFNCFIDFFIHRKLLNNAASCDFDCSICDNVNCQGKICYNKKLKNERGIKNE